jgi:hypothetical protein
VLFCRTEKSTDMEVRKRCGRDSKGQIPLQPKGSGETGLAPGNLWQGSD